MISVVAHLWKQFVATIYSGAITVVVCRACRARSYMRCIIGAILEYICVHGLSRGMIGYNFFVCGKKCTGLWYRLGGVILSGGSANPLFISSECKRLPKCIYICSYRQSQKRDLNSLKTRHIYISIISSVVRYRSSQKSNSASSHRTCAS